MSRAMPPADWAENMDPTGYRAPSQAATATLVLGILALVFVGPLGLILGLCAPWYRRQALDDIAAGRADSNAPTFVTAGHICAFIGVAIGSLSTLAIVLVLAMMLLH